MKTILRGILYVTMILGGMLGIYTFVFVSHLSALKKTALLIIAAGILLSGISGILNLKENRK